MAKEITYRDEVVQQIKEAGQELINKAESMVGPDLTLITSVDINVHLESSQEFPSIPEIRYDIVFANESTLKRICR